MVMPLSTAGLIPLATVGDTFWVSLCPFGRCFVVASKASLGILQSNVTHVTYTHHSNHRGGKGNAPMTYNWLKSVRIHPW